MAEHVSFLTREIFIVYLFLFYKIYSQYEKKKKKNSISNGRTNIRNSPTY